MANQQTVLRSRKYRVLTESMSLDTSSSGFQHKHTSQCQQVYAYVTLGASQIGPVAHLRLALKSMFPDSYMHFCDCSVDKNRLKLVPKLRRAHNNNIKHYGLTFALLVSAERASSIHVLRGPIKNIIPLLVMWIL